MQINQASSTISQYQQSFAAQEQKKEEDKSTLAPPAKKEAEKQGDKVDISQAGKSSLKQELTDEEKKVVEELKRIDRETRSHEQAHMGAGGQYVSGGASYEYQQGPDNNRYAVAGEVQIDTSAVSGDPTATKLKMQQVRRAALAPANPSPQDLRVAAQASQRAMQAAGEEMELRQQEMKESEANAPGKSESSQAGNNDQSSQAGEKNKESSSFISRYAADSYEKSSGAGEIPLPAIQNKALSLFA